jgi:hypothetical protein
MIPVDSSSKTSFCENHETKKIPECRQSCTIKAVFSLRFNHFVPVLKSGKLIKSPAGIAVATEGIPAGDTGGWGTFGVMSGVTGFWVLP